MKAFIVRHNKAENGYRFDDYWRLGLVLVMLFFAVSVGLVPLVWRF